jgi:uncharacterized membrane protein
VHTHPHTLHHTTSHTNHQQLLFPVFPIATALAYVVLWSLVAMYIYSVGELVPKTGIRSTLSSLTTIIITVITTTVITTTVCTSPSLTSSSSHPS